MNDSQITDLLRALGLGCLAVDIIGDLYAAYFDRPGVTGFAGVALALLVAASLFDGSRWVRRRAALKRLKQQLGDKATRPTWITPGGDQ